MSTKTVKTEKTQRKIETYLNIDSFDTERFKNKFDALPEEMEMTIKEKLSDFSVSFGDVWCVNLGVNVGSEMDKVRPVIVASENSSFNRFSKLITVVPITKSTCKYPSQFEVTEDMFIMKPDAFVEDEPSTGIAKAEQVRSVSKGRFLYYLGKLTEEGKSELRDSLKNHFGI